MMTRFIVLGCLLVFCVCLSAQSFPVHSSLQLVVSEKTSGELLPLAHVQLKDSLNTVYTKTTNLEGRVIFDLPKGKYQVVVTYLGYEKSEQYLLLSDEKPTQIRLTASSTLLNEVVVTAEESQGMTASSRIDRKAMEHLQPSSFTDLLELLPGKVSQDPSLNAVNLIRLREAGSSGADYDYSSLGTMFMVDGIPLSGDANMQTLSSGVTPNDTRNITSKGIDMRTLSTDNIESVEVIRGIPSAKYGDLTSGMVKIERRNSQTPLEARFKSDQFSKLFYVGKGFGLNDNRTILNLSADYLDSKSDPRNPYENYKRLTGSLRYNSWKPLFEGRFEWRSSLDYTGSFDNVKADPDIDEKNDHYKSSFNQMALNGALRWNSDGVKLLRTLGITSSLSLQNDRMTQEKDVYLNTPSFVPNSSEAGEHDGLFLPNTYHSSLLVEGKPFRGYLQVDATLTFEALKTHHKIEFGGEYATDKNFGRGEVYDAALPPSTTMRGRPRAFSNIPALQRLSFFAEDQMCISIGTHHLQMSGGVRGAMLLGMDKNYDLQGKLFIDPRINLKWQFPSLPLWGESLETALGGGYGVHTKMPTLAQLYPDLYYYDVESLNYYHTNPDYRRLWLTTFIEDRVNYNLQPARNHKWEVRGDFRFRRNQLSVTYFREDCRDGFRELSNPLIQNYRKYSTEGIDPGDISAAPHPSDLNFTDEVLITTFGKTGNGSRTRKEGVEFQFASERIQLINTRVTINGAWLRTLYSNSVDLYYDANVILNGKKLPYLGIYDYREGSVKEQFNTNIMFDTYLPKLGLTFSTSFQNMWFTSSQSLLKNRVPVAYVDASGTVFPYTEASLVHPELQWLVLKEYAVTATRVPYALMVNFKANKQFGKHLNLSVFVNKMLDYTPDYTQNGVTIHRSVSPYFGMEMNIRL